MKNFFRPFMIVAVAASLFATSSCTKTCDAGYEGSDCKTEVRTKYFGSYKVSGNAVVTGGGSDVISDLIVTVTTASADVQKFNFSYVIGGDNYQLTGTLNENGTAFTVPSQTAQGLNYTGSGSFTTTSMSVLLTETDGSQVTTITLQGPKN